MKDAVTGSKHSEHGSKHYTGEDHGHTTSTVGSYDGQTHASYGDSVEGSHSTISPVHLSAYGQHHEHYPEAGHAAHAEGFNQPVHSEQIFGGGIPSERLETRSYIHDGSLAGLNPSERVDTQSYIYGGSHAGLHPSERAATQSYIHGGTSEGQDGFREHARSGTTNLTQALPGETGQHEYSIPSGPTEHVSYGELEAGDRADYTTGERGQDIGCTHGESDGFSEGHQGYTR